MIHINYRDGAPRILLDFLTYMETIKGKSQKTASEYFLDLRLFFRYIKLQRTLIPSGTPLNEIRIDDVNLELISSVSLSDIYDFLIYISHDRPKHQNSPNTEFGAVASTRARKTAAIRSFYKYLTDKAHVIEVNPTQNLDTPKIRQSLPRYLTLDESIKLLSSADNGPYKERDYCILTLFLNCGLRVSELAGINVSDIRDDTLRVLGKGNKERTVYLNEACIDALQSYLKVRTLPLSQDKNALFVSRQRNRVSVPTIKWLVKKYLTAAGLDEQKYSVHKLRHTAATLMYQNGVDVRALQEILGHENLNTTMIYTHVSDSDLKAASKANPLSKLKKDG